MTNWKIAGGAAATEHFQLRMLNRPGTYQGADKRAVLELAASVMPAPNIHKLLRSGVRSVLAAAAAALAWRDAGLTPPENGDRCAVLAWGHDGSHTENLRYWNDYLANNRCDGRGHYFVGTLPSTAPGECAIAYDLHGPVFYVDGPDDPEEIAAEIAALFDTGEMEQIVLLFPDAP